MVARRRQDPDDGGHAGAASVEIQLPAGELRRPCSGGKAGGDKSGKAAYPRRLALMILHFGVYYAAARLGLLMIISYVSLFWCGNGITFVFLFFAPLWEWPLYLVGATAALFLACIGFESDGLVLALAMCNVLELIAGGVLFRLLLKQLKTDPMVIGHERSLVPLMACAILPSMVAALPGALAVERWYPDCSMWQPYASWAFAHSTGNYTTAYLILVIRKSIFEETGKGTPSRQLLHIMKNRLTGMNRSTLRPAMEYCVCLAIMGFIFLSNMVPVAGLLLFPVLGWVSLRFSQMLSAVMVSWTTMVVIVSMILGRRMWLDFDRHPGEADDERATLASMLIMHTTLFLAVLTTQFVSINIQAKNRALQHIRSSAAEKQAFFQHVSHEFRTPLSVIIGFCEALEASPLDRQQQEQLQCMSNAGNMLSNIVDDLLELFRMEVGSAKLHLERTELVPFFFNCCRGIQQYATLKPHVEVSFRALEDVPRIVMLDQTRLQQIMYNLGSNAVKYSNAGHVSILLSRVASKKREGACNCGETAPAGRQADGKSAAKGCGEVEAAADATAGSCCCWRRRCDSRPAPGPNAPPHGSQQCLKPPPACTAPCCAGSADGGKGMGGCPFSPSQGTGRWLVGETRGVRKRDEPLQWAPESDIDGLRQRRTRLRLAVTDTGVGIPAEAMAGIFDRFERCKGHRNETMARGTGLGLSVTKQLVELMQGDIEVASTVGQGSTFTVTFPVVEVAAEHTRLQQEALKLQALKQAALYHPVMPRCTEALPPPLQVLVVEDSVLNQRLLYAMLRRLGHCCTIAPDGETAIALATSPDADFDLILLDLGLPAMDGFEVMRAVRRTSSLKCRTPERRVPIAIISARTMEDEALQECRRAGADGFCTKPFTAKSLHAEISRLIAQGRIRMPPPLLPLPPMLWSANQP